MVTAASVWLTTVILTCARPQTLTTLLTGKWRKRRRGRAKSRVSEKFSHSSKIMLLKQCKAKGKSEIEGCRTINCQRCIFPFKYNGLQHDKCITVDSENGAPWCAVDVSEKFKKINNLSWSLQQLQEDGEATYGAWEDCDMSGGSCPIENNAGMQDQYNLDISKYL